jgi:hypothetical protein
MRRFWIAKLGDARITTLEGLALAQLETIEGIRPEIYERIREQARMQFAARMNGTPGSCSRLRPIRASRCCRVRARVTSSTTSRATRSTRPQAGLEYLHGVIADGEFREDLGSGSCIAESIAVQT